MGAWRHALGFGCGLQRHRHPVIDGGLARHVARGWRRFSVNAQGDRNRNSIGHARAHTGTNAGADAPAGSASRPGANGYFRKRAAISPTRDGDDSNREDIAGDRVLDPSRLQIRAL